MDLLCRFAPSPNGALHLGHAFSALCNERVAERIGARCLLRLEDIDTARCTPALERGILDDLRWFGFPFAEPVRRQSACFPAYEAALARLADRDLLFPCFCTRGDILRALGNRPDWPRDPDGSPLYPGTCRTLSPAARAARLAAGEPHALRLDMGRALGATDSPLGWTEFWEGQEAVRIAARPTRWGDAVLRRKDIPASYHIAVVLDDADQGISDIVRGADLFAATALHRLLQALLGLPEPRYHHHRLVLDSTGQKLSKSRDAVPLAALRRQGLTPEDVREMLDAMMGPPAAQGSSVVSQ
jgi:glutamyl-Q tRNA(Asp) synthetase